MAAKRKKSPSAKSATKKTARTNTPKKVSERPPAKKSAPKKKVVVKKKVVAKKKTTVKKKAVTKKKTARKKIVRKRSSVFITSIGGPVAVEWTSYDRINSKEVINQEQIVKFDNVAVETKKRHVMQLVQLSEKLVQLADVGSRSEEHTSELQSH